MASFKKIKVLGVQFAKLKNKQVVHLLRQEIKNREKLFNQEKRQSKKPKNFWGGGSWIEKTKILPFFVTTPNPEILVNAYRDPSFRQILNNSDLAIVDGIGVLWASYYNTLKIEGFWHKKYLKWKTLFGSIFRSKNITKILPERIAGSDLFLQACEIAMQENLSIFLLGAMDGVAEKCGERLQEIYPSLAIAGTFAGSPREEDEKEIQIKIRDSQADILFVAYGSPSQEKWIWRNLEYLSKVKMVCGIGGSFDFVAGVRKRSPKFLRNLGLEWTWRAIIQPSRFKRIWTAIYTFPKIVEKEKTKNKR